MIFLTGATGLVGMRMLYDLRRQGRQVRAFHRHDSDLTLVETVMRFYHGQEDISTLMDGVEWFQGDLLDVLSLSMGMRGCDSVIHAAAAVSFHPRDEDLLYEVNVLGTRYVVDAALEAGCRRLLHISSVAAVGRRAGKAVDEEDVWKDGPEQSGYAKSKYAAELEVWRGSEEGLNIVIVNPSLILGAGKKGASSAQLFEGIPGRSRFPAEGHANVVDVRDVSSMAIRLLDGSAEASRFILHGATLSNEQFFRLMSIAMGEEPPPASVPSSWLRWAARIVSWKDVIFRTKSMLTQETIAGTLSSYDYDVSKVKEELQQEFISAEDSIAYFGQFYRGESA